MKTLAILLLTATPAAALTCDGPTPEALGLKGVTFTEVAAVPAGEDSPVAQCRIRGLMAERTGSDGQDYALSFELALPDDWNGDFVHQFNGGNDGQVRPATGALQAGTGDRSPLARGFAVISSDAGHDGAARPDRGIAGGAAFGADFEARQMYGYKAVATLQPVAEQMVAAYYGREIGHNYGIGCSNGGRHAMVAASRMPEAFDGLLLGAPGFNLPRSALQHAHDVQAFSAVNEDIRQAFSTEDLTLVADAILAKCDALDGLADGISHDTAACQQAFDVTTLQCAEGQNTACLSAAQVTALVAIHEGPQGADGPLYSDWSWDAGIGAPNWRTWKLESGNPNWDRMPIIAVMGASSLAQVFTVPPVEVGGEPADLLAYLRGFDLASQAGQIDATSDAYPESPMQVMAPPGADDPDLTAFRDAGGKMMIYHGVADPVFSVNDTANWFAALNENMGEAQDFAQFYPVPGMTHCQGGPAAEAFDLLTPLIAWVKDGTTPEPVTATVRANNEAAPEALRGATRPLCPAPLVARYQGGDTADAASFACQP
ncbi:MAG: tannase/feruloyl esterase family alpha/beta hydrolase [Paracoccus sp. (in: a-proteobacteria)]|nr:tannase/feruloyl esterase family alpha/beta hydrolase [Paracoccus sp. (in: a-proteobacteria)]